MVTDGVLGVIAIEATSDPLSPCAGFDGGVGELEAPVGFAVAKEPAHPLVPNEPPRTRNVISKLVVQTVFLNAEIM